MADSHPPRDFAPSAASVLGSEAIVRDVATGERRSSEAWLDAHAAAERRPRDECVDALMNAIARGDLIVEAPGTP